MYQLKKMPSKYYVIKPFVKVSLEHLLKIKKAQIPRSHNNRWIVHYEEPWLYFHRLLSKNCIYKVHIAQLGNEYFIDEVLINGDNEQYKYEPENATIFFQEIYRLFLDSDPGNNET